MAKEREPRKTTRTIVTIATLAIFGAGAIKDCGGRDNPIPPSCASSQCFKTDIPYAQRTLPSQKR